ncbi:MAG: MATE family efflux transporter [Methanobrevibacter sp.]
MINKSEDNIKLIREEPKKAVLKLSFPIMLSMILITLYNISDTLWVSGLGADALAAIGLITPLFSIAVNFGSAIGVGTTSLISRSIGSENYEQANNSALHAIFLCILLSIIISILNIIFMKPLLILIGAHDVMDYAMDYSLITFSFLFVFLFSNIALAIFDSEGNVRNATLAVFISNILNIILDPIFIYTLNMGMSGAAWATILSASISCIAMAYWMWGKKNMYLDLSFKNFSFNPKLIWDILKISIPSSVESILGSGCLFVINTFLVQAGGATAVAVYTACMKLIQLAMIPMRGVGSSFFTVAGVILGKGDYKKLREVSSYAIKLCFLISIGIMIILWVFPSQIAFLFSYTEASSELTPQIANTLRIFSIYALAIPLGTITTVIFQAAGKTLYCLILTFIKTLLIEIVFAYLFCFVFGWGVIGIYAAVIMTTFVGGFISYIWSEIFIRNLENSSNNQVEEC